MDDLPFNFDKLFLQYTQEQKDVVDAAVVEGHCKDFTEYVRLTSRRYGLELAEIHFKRLVEQWNNR
jgi:hypothetical protein